MYPWKFAMKVSIYPWKFACKLSIKLARPLKVWLQIFTKSFNPMFIFLVFFSQKPSVQEKKWLEHHGMLRVQIENHQCTNPKRVPQLNCPPTNLPFFSWKRHLWRGVQRWPGPGGTAKVTVILLPEVILMPGVILMPKVTLSCSKWS